MSARAKPDGITTTEIMAVLDITRQAVGLIARQKGWSPIGRICPGGIVYDLDSVPHAIAHQVRDRRITRLINQHSGPALLALPPNAAAVVTPAALAAATAPTTIGDLTRWQIDVGTARLVFVDEIERWAEELGRDGAIRKMERMAKARELPERLQELVPIANARSGAKSGKHARTLSRGRLYDWCKKVRGKVTPSERVCALAPKSRGRKWDLDADVLAALAKYRQPNKPSLAYCVREVIAKTGGERESLYHRCRRAIGNLPAPVFHAGRNTGAAFKALQVFRRREFLSLEPNEVWVGDGHAAKLKVTHPITGNPFQPEVTVILDASDRYIVGWSVSLSENCIAVSDALRHGVGQHGIPLIYYSDNGGGQKNKMLDAPVTGISGALGFQHETGIPGNPQGRGVIERLWPTVLIPLAKQFDTFQGRGNDRDTLKNVSREINRALRASKKGEVTVLPRKLPTWEQFLRALEQALTSYNQTHQHSSLPKLDGTHHATPAEWRAHRMRETGVQVYIPPANELAVLFMPQVMRKCERGEVRLFNGIYFHKDLMLIDGRYAPVAHDIHDCSRVWVRHPDGGQLIAVAELNGNRGDFFPKPYIEQLREERAKRRMGLLQSKMDEVQAELDGGTGLDHRATAEPLLANVVPDSVVALQAPAANGGRPRFTDDLSLLAWLAEHRDDMDDYDWDWMVERAGVSQTFDLEWRRLFGPRKNTGGAEDFEATAR